MPKPTYANTSHDFPSTRTKLTERPTRIKTPTNSEAAATDVPETPLFGLPTLAHIDTLCERADDARFLANDLEKNTPTQAKDSRISELLSVTQELMHPLVPIYETIAFHLVALKQHIREHTNSEQGSCAQHCQKQVGVRSAIAKKAEEGYQAVLRLNRESMQRYSQLQSKVPASV